MTKTHTLMKMGTASKQNKIKLTTTIQMTMATETLRKLKKQSYNQITMSKIKMIVTIVTIL